MGTRADFYIKAGDSLEWLGSVAWDGYDIEEMKPEHASESPRNKSCIDVRTATDEQQFRAALLSYFSHRDDVTLPAQGWPWPWEDSTTTDRAYVFSDGRVICYAWGKEIVPGDDDAEGPEPSGGWPDMSAVQSVTLGRRSGVIVVGS